MNLPNILTVSRIVLIPVFVIAYYLPFEWNAIACASLFFIAGCTDYLDGYLARKLNQATPFGAFLDPVADKLMVAIVLVLIVQEHNNVLLTIASAVIIGREITIASLREWMAEIGQRAAVKVSPLGKWKTSVQMLAIGFLLFQDDVLGMPVTLIGNWLLYVAAILTLWSMVNYLSAAYIILKE